MLNKSVFFALIPLLLTAEPLIERTQVHMGTFATIALPSSHQNWFEKSFGVIRSVEKALSSYDSEADIARLNRERSATIGPYTYEALSLSRKYFEESEGYFDVTVGSITKKLYRFGEDERLVSDAALQSAMIGLDGLAFDDVHAVLAEGLYVDLGGMGKGYGVDQVAALWRENGVDQGKIALSGDIRCMQRCRLGIQNPFTEAVLMQIVTARPDSGISTSGNYRRYIESKKSSHLIDPKAKASQQGFASVTVAGNHSNSDLDAYATAASVMPVSKAAAFLERTGVDYLLITTEGDRLVNRDFSRYRFFYLLGQ
jgi:thiamine biosynthesis lipoprotein